MSFGNSSCWQGCQHELYCVPTAPPRAPEAPPPSHRGILFHPLFLRKPGVTDWLSVGAAAQSINATARVMYVT